MPEPVDDKQDPQDSPKMVEVKVGGTTKQVSVEDLVTNYQKGTSADAKFQEASELRKQAEEALQLQADIEALKTNDEGAFRRVAARMNWDETQVEEALKARRAEEIRDAMGDSGGDGGTGDADNASEEGLDLDAIAAKVAAKIAPAVAKMRGGTKVGFDQLDPRLQRAVAVAFDKGVKEALQNNVDKDEVLGIIVKKGSTGQRDTVLSMVREEARRRADAGDDVSDPKVVSSVLGSVRTQIAGLGVAPAGTLAPSPGLGRSGGGMSSLHQSGTPRARPKDGMSDSDYGEYITEQLNAAMMEETPE